jgi:Lrp/AsnC family transcriptional regulator for asnA, asnC and gidA
VEIRFLSKQAKPDIMDIDKTDKQILSLLMQDAKMPYTEIAQKIHVSGGTVHVRMKKLHDLGVVKGFNLAVDYSKLDFDITAFLGIFLDKSSLYVEVIEALKLIPEVVGAHYTTGNYGIFAKIVCKDTNHLRDVLYGKIQKIQGIQRTETFISLEESIDRSINILDSDPQ